MTEQERLEKNKQISQTQKATKERHAQMDCKVFTVKIQENHLSTLQKIQLKMMFVEAKWIKNYVLSWSKENPNNKIWTFNEPLKTITHKDKDMKDVTVDIKYLGSQMKQSIVAEMVSNIRTIIYLQKAGHQSHGSLKFVKEVKSINLKQYGCSHKIVSTKRVKIQNLSGTVVVNGLQQFNDIDGIEFANGKLLNLPDGYYVQFVCYIPKQQKKISNGKIIGIDFGCSTSFTTSEGEKISVKVQESERLKTLQRKLSRQKKGSESWYRTVGQIKVYYQKMTNIKKDKTNKLVAKFLEYENIVIQDEQIASWQKGRNGKAVQHSILGKVKAKLIQNEKTIVLSKTVPTTKVCTCCGSYNDALKLWDRIFVCPKCGYEEDRDIHAAKNMLWFYNHKVGVGRTNFKRVEMEKQIQEIVNNSSWRREKSMKHEASRSLA